jgi:hypothetical protein
VAFDIRAWSDYGVAIVGAAAVLVGLLFVAVSVNSASADHQQSARRAHHDEAYLAALRRVNR